MKKLALLLTLVLIGCNQSAAIDHEQEIFDINQNLDSYEITENDILESTEGGFQKTFKLDNQIKKIEQIHYGEMGRSEIEAFFKNDQPIYILRKSYFYEEPIYVNSDPIEIDRQTEEYFLDNYMPVKLLVNDEEVDLNEIDQDELEFLLQLL